VDRDEFESKVLELWMKSRVPLTQANLQYFAGVARRTLTTWIDELLNEGFLDIEIDDAEDLTYNVPGARRSADGPQTCEAYERKRELVDEAKKRILARRAGATAAESAEVPAVDSTENESAASNEDDDGASIAGMMGKAALFASTTALVTLDKPLALLDKPRAKGEKSLLASAGLSILGPVGWLYAGSFREAVPATIAQVAILSIVPGFLLAPFMVVGAIASSAIGLGYAWKFNKKKGRTPLFLAAKNKSKDKKK